MGDVTRTVLKDGSIQLQVRDLTIRVSGHGGEGAPSMHSLRVEAALPNATTRPAIEYNQKEGVTAAMLEKRVYKSMHGQTRETDEAQLHTLVPEDVTKIRETLTKAFEDGQLNNGEIEALGRQTLAALLSAKPERSR